MYNISSTSTTLAVSCTYEHHDSISRNLIYCYFVRFVNCRTHEEDVATPSLQLPLLIARRLLLSALHGVTLFLSFYSDHAPVCYYSCNDYAALGYIISRAYLRLLLSRQQKGIRCSGVAVAN